MEQYASDGNECWKWYSNIQYNYSNIFEYSFLEIVSLSVREIVILSGHQTYPDTGTVHNQFNVQKFRSWVSITYLELSSLHMLNCFLTTCKSRRRPSICKFKFISICVTCETRCQHESIDSIMKTESSSNRTIGGEAWTKEFLFMITFQQAAIF